MTDNNQPPKPYASPVCYAHELDPLLRDHSGRDGETWRDVDRWRRAERERLRKLRRDLAQSDRQAAEQIIASRLRSLLDSRDSQCVGAYWPIQGEPDLRAWMREQADAGRTVALPVVLAAGKALGYARWRPTEPMSRGVWGIAEPASRIWVEPDFVIVPLLGVDRENHRLGNGGGYFDRSLAAADPRPFVVGVGFACARIETIYPQAHDVPMDEVVIGST